MGQTTVVLDAFVSICFISFNLFYLTSYRRVPGDQCQGGDEKLVTDAIQYTDTKIRCKPKEEDSYGFSQEIKKTTPSSKKVILLVSTTSYSANLGILYMQFC